MPKKDILPVSSFPLSTPLSPPAEDGLARLDHYIEAWLKVVGSRSPNTADTYRESLRRSGADIWNARPNMVTPHWAAELYARWLDQWETNTANVTVAAWAALYDDLIAQGIITGPNPWKVFRRKRPKEKVGERILTEAEVKALFRHAAPGVDRTLLRFLYYTGCRISEAVGLTWGDVHLDGEGTPIVTVLGKGRKTRWVRLRPAVWQEMWALSDLHEPHLKIFPLTRQQAWNHMHAAAQRAGLVTPGRTISPHCLRHSHATHALEHGANIMQVKEALGHARLDTTQTYVNLRPGPRSEAYLPDL